MKQSGWDLLQLDHGLVATDVALDSGSGYRVFQALPFLTIPADGERPSPSRIVNTWDDFPASILDLLAGIDSCITGQVDAICLAEVAGSFPVEPLEIAARTAYERGTSIIAAGENGGHGSHPVTALAQAPWVIPVAAGFGETGIAPGALIAATVARAVVCLRVCLRLTLGNLTDQQRGQWGPLSAPLRFPLIGLPGGAIDPEVFPAPGPNAALQLSQGTTHVRVSRGGQERDWYAAVVSALRKAGVALSVSAGPEPAHRALGLMAGRTPDDRRISGLSREEVRPFLSALVPSRWLQIFSAEALQRFETQEIARLDAELGPLWSAAQADTLTDLFLSGARFIMP
jgi:hypothetical protein